MKKRNFILVGIFIVVLILGIYVVRGFEKSEVEKFLEKDKSEILGKYDIDGDGFLDHDEKSVAHKDLGIDTENCPYKQPESETGCLFKLKGLNNPEGHE